MREIATLAELRSLAGEEVAVSDWVKILQERIDRFAEATGDDQWIHVDPGRCERESPFGAPVAHGFLTLSLLPKLLLGSVRITGKRMVVNYGLNKVRFPAPVPVGSRVRGRVRLLSVEDFEGGAQVSWQVTVEREGGGKPVCVAESVMRHYS